MENNRTRVDDTMQIDLLRLFFVLKKKIWLMILVGVLFAAAALTYTHFRITPMYTSTSTMLVLTKETTLSSLADLQMGSQLTSDYKVLIESRSVLEQVINNLDMNISYRTLRNNLRITNLQDTRILSISVDMPDPELAKTVVDEISDVSSAYIEDKMEVTTAPKIIEYGEVPTAKTSPDVRKNTVLGFLIGVMLVAGITVVLELMDDSIKNEDDVEMYLNLPVFAVVPNKEPNTSGKKKSNKKQRKKR